MRALTCGCKPMARRHRRRLLRPPPLPLHRHSERAELPSWSHAVLGRHALLHLWPVPPACTACNRVHSVVTECTHTPACPTLRSRKTGRIATLPGQTLPQHAPPLLFSAQLLRAAALPSLLTYMHASSHDTWSFSLFSLPFPPAQCFRSGLATGHPFYPFAACCGTVHVGPMHWMPGAAPAAACMAHTLPSPFCACVFQSASLC